MIGVQYKTYSKKPAEAGGSPKLEYLLGTVFQANGTDTNRGNILCKMIRGNIPLSERVDVGAAEKVYIPKELTGRMLLQTSDGWMLFALYGRLQENFTDKANNDNMTIEQAFDYVSGILENRGYGNKLTPTQINADNQILFEDF